MNKRVFWFEAAYGDNLDDLVLSRVDRAIIKEDQYCYFTEYNGISKKHLHASPEAAIEKECATSSSRWINSFSGSYNWSEDSGFVYTDEDDKDLVRRAKVGIIDNCIKKCRTMIAAERERLDMLEERINKELEDCAND